MSLCGGREADSSGGVGEMTEVGGGGGPAKEPTRLCLRNGEGRRDPEDVEERKIERRAQVQA